eukprot:scaffold1744_cov252-Pinguiococcus_pyrenoidosus.AAC.19
MTITLPDQQLRERECLGASLGACAGRSPMEPNGAPINERINYISIIKEVENSLMLKYGARGEEVLQQATSSQPDGSWQVTVTLLGVSAVARASNVKRAKKEAYCQVILCASAALSTQNVAHGFCRRSFDSCSGFKALTSTLRAP